MTILVIESLKEDQDSFIKALTAGGYTQLLVAESSQDAYSKLGLIECTGIPSAFGTELIIIGAAMPEDGVELCRAIKESVHYQDVPILIASHGVLADGMTMSIAYGALDYIRKPFNEHEFLSRVRSAIRLKHEIDRRKARERELLEATRQLYDLNTMLTKLSLMDGLTGVANRRNFDRLLDKEWRRAMRAGHTISLILIDIDHFKNYNDHYGHQGGDECLKQVAQALKDALQRPGDIVCRYGGEEFAVILPDTPVKGAFVVAENLRAMVEHASIPHQHSKVAPVVTISLGVATMKPKDEQQTPKDIIQQADEALYGAKKGGRNSVHVHASVKPKARKAG